MRMRSGKKRIEVVVINEPNFPTQTGRLEALIMTTQLPK